MVPVSHHLNYSSNRGTNIKRMVISKSLYTSENKVDQRRMWIQNESIYVFKYTRSKNRSEDTSVRMAKLQFNLVTKQQSCYFQVSPNEHYFLEKYLSPAHSNSK